MRIKSIGSKGLIGIGMYSLMASTLTAGTNPVTLTFVGGRTSFSAGNPGSANYSACRDGRVPSSNLPLYFNDLGGGSYASQVTTGASACTGISNVCSAPLSLSSGDCCCLELSLSANISLSAGTYTLIAEVGTAPNTASPVYGGQALPLEVEVSSGPPPSATLAVTSPITMPLALSVNCSPSSSCFTTQNAALTGTPRKITIQNTGGSPANITTVTPSGLPTGTTLSGCASTTLSAGGTCDITVTPGQNASSDCTTGIAPTPGTITVNASNATSVTATAEVLSYGCVYQGGFIYSVNDATPTTGSIGGKVASLVDQAAPYIDSGPQSTSIIWSSNGNGSTSDDVNYTAILGINEISTTSSPSPAGPVYPSETPPYTACNGAFDGACDSGNIVSYYNFNRVSGGSAPTPRTYYAAGLCEALINSYSDWYLPAICEMDAVNGSVTCPSGAQSMLGSLGFLVGDPGAPTPSTSCSPPSSTNCLAGDYWSSTETSTLPQDVAWGEHFSSGGSFQGNGSKSNQLGVRCSRALSL